MTAHSGKFAVVNGQSTVRNWTVNEINEAKPFVASNTLGATGRRVSVWDWNGTFSAYGGSPSMFPGDAFTFAGYTAPDDDTQGSDGQRYSGTGIIDSIVITWNWANGDILSYVANFSGNGALAADTGLYTDSTTPTVPPAVDTKITYDDSGDTDWTNISQAVLTLTAANQAYVNSSSVVSGKAWRQRKAGILDATLAVTEDRTLRASLPDIGDSLDLKLWVNATEFWQLQWMFLENFSNISADRETGAIIQRTANLSMNCHDGTSLGTIVHPDLTVKWNAP